MLLEQKDCWTTPIKIKSYWVPYQAQNPQKRFLRVEKRYHTFLWDTMYVYVFETGNSGRRRNLVLKEKSLREI